MLSEAKRTNWRDMSNSVSPTGHADSFRVGPYALCSELATGGMGTVYLARDQRSGPNEEFVAVKLMHQHLASDPNFVSMFEDEAEIASLIDHPNVCSVVTHGTWQGRQYLAMEYLPGKSLHEVRQRLTELSAEYDAAETKLSMNVAQAIEQACRGVHAAHELRDASGEHLHVVHRDITPSNLFLTLDGEVKVMDFGLISARRKRSKTRTGIIKGKLAYVAPESLRGQQNLDRRADIWGLGVVTWELLTGKRLFKRDDELSTLRAVSEDPIPRPSSVRPGIPDELDDIVMRALEREPDNRFGSADEMADALKNFIVEREPISGDLVAWIDELFPNARAEQLRVEQLALRSLVSIPPAAAIPLDTFGSDATAAAISTTYSGKARVSNALRERGSSIAALAIGLCLGFSANAWTGHEHHGGAPEVAASHAGVSISPQPKSWSEPVQLPADKTVTAKVIHTDKDGRLVLQLEPLNFRDNSPPEAHVSTPEAGLTSPEPPVVENERIAQVARKSESGRKGLQLIRTFTGSPTRRVD